MTRSTPIARALVAAATGLLLLPGCGKLSKADATRTLQAGEYDHVYCYMPDMSVHSEPDAHGSARYSFDTKNVKCLNELTRAGLLKQDECLKHHDSEADLARLRSRGLLDANNKPTVDGNATLDEATRAYVKEAIELAVSCLSYAYIPGGGARVHEQTFEVECGSGKVDTVSSVTTAGSTATANFTLTVTRNEALSRSLPDCSLHDKYHDAQRRQFRRGADGKWELAPE